MAFTDRVRTWHGVGASAPVPAPKKPKGKK